MLTPVPPSICCSCVIATCISRVYEIAQHFFAVPRGESFSLSTSEANRFFNTKNQRKTICMICSLLVDSFNSSKSFWIWNFSFFPFSIRVNSNMYLIHSSLILNKSQSWSSITLESLFTHIAISKWSIFIEWSYRVNIVKYFILTFEVFVIKRSPVSIISNWWICRCSLVSKPANKQKKNEQTNTFARAVWNANEHSNLSCFYIVIDACHQLCVYNHLFGHGCAKWMMLNMHVLVFLLVASKQMLDWRCVCVYLMLNVNNWCVYIDCFVHVFATFFSFDTRKLLISNL